MTDLTAKLAALTDKITEQQHALLIKQGFTHVAADERNYKATVKTGRKYANVDIGTSGRYMVELATGRIFGIKGYGQIHRGHYFGTLDEIDQWYWGGYYAGKMKGAQC